KCSASAGCDHSTGCIGGGSSEGRTIPDRGRKAERLLVSRAIQRKQGSTQDKHPTRPSQGQMRWPPCDLDFGSFYFGLTYRSACFSAPRIPTQRRILRPRLLCVRVVTLQSITQTQKRFHLTSSSSGAPYLALRMDRHRSPKVAS